MKIIVLDKNFELAKTISFYLQLHGHDCITVDNPENTLSYVSTLEPDVLISEYDDRGDYFLLFQKIREQHKKTKIIILTSCDCSISKQDNLRELEISSILKKPITPNYLLEIINVFEKKHSLNFLKTG